MRKVIAALLCLLPLAACTTSPYATRYAARLHNTCVNHDLIDRHGSNAQQDC